MKRFGGVARLEDEKLRQAKAIIKQRKMARIMVSWQVHMVQHRVKQISNEMIEKFQTMKLRHQLFARWVNQHRVNHKIKAKALSIVTQRQQYDRHEAIYGADCDAETESSTTSL